MVLSRVFHPPATADQPGIWEDYEPEVEITHDKDGGLKHGETF